MPKNEIPVVAVVLFKTTQSTDSDALRELLEHVGPTYANIPNLHRKYFISAEGIGGGIYEWASRSQANEFYDEAWHHEASVKFGSSPEITYYEVAATADGIQHDLEIFL